MSDTPDDGPPLLRPIPRRPQRPFNLNIQEPTPPGEDDADDDSSSPSSPPSPLRSSRNNPPPALNLESLNSRLLLERSPNRNNNSSSHVLADPGSEAGAGGNNSSSISRAQSILNLTGSTLMGIYTPNTYGPDRMASLLTDGSSNRDGPGTPWGTGAETPARLDDIDDDEDEELSDDEADDETEGEREMRRRRRSSQHAAEVMGRRRASLILPPQPSSSPPQPLSSSSSSPQAPPLLSLSASPLALRLAPRALLLSALGVLYGILVARLLDKFWPAAGGAATPYGWKYMAFWGVSGVVLGGLLPWFDGVWEGAFGRREGGGGGDAVTERRRRRRRQVGRRVGSVGGPSLLVGKGLQQQQEEEAAVPGPHWSLAVRGIGAFAGIAFAIRRLSWDSTLQVSVTLGLINPVLWYLIDRSVPGLLMAGAVGITGSAIFSMIPFAMSSSSVPFSATLSPWAYFLDSEASWTQQQQQQQSFNESSSSYHANGGSPLMILNGGGLGSGGAGRHALESAVWMLSVLFCCCVCFGNIGRWLALMSRNNSSSSSSSNNRPRSGSVSGGADGFAKGRR